MPAASKSKKVAETAPAKQVQDKKTSTNKASKVSEPEDVANKQSKKNSSTPSTQSTADQAASSVSPPLPVAVKSTDAKKSTKKTKNNDDMVDVVVAPVVPVETSSSTQIKQLSKPHATNNNISQPDRIAPSTLKALAAASALLGNKQKKHDGTELSENLRTLLAKVPQKQQSDNIIDDIDSHINNNKRKTQHISSSTTTKRTRHILLNDSESDIDDDIDVLYDDTSYTIDQITNQSLLPLDSALIALHDIRTQDDDNDDKIMDQKTLRPTMSNNIKPGAKAKTAVPDSPEKLARTVFISNVSVNVKDRDIIKFIGAHGKVESIRYRSYGVSSLSVAKWVAFAQKKFHDNRDTMNAYVVLSSPDDAQKCAKLLNQNILLDKHVHVDVASNPSKVDFKLSIFVGNLPSDIQEESLYTFFTGKLAPSSNDIIIHNIRCIRDATTGIGKGFAFITFNDILYVQEALSLDGSISDLFSSRPLRITKVSPDSKSSHFQTQLEKRRMLSKKQAVSDAASRRIESRKKALLGDQYTPPTATTSRNKRAKIQGAYQRVVGSASASTGGYKDKKARHTPGPNAGKVGILPPQSWMGAVATPGKGQSVLGRKRTTTKNKKGGRK